MRAVLVALMGAAFVSGVAGSWVEEMRGSARGVFFWSELVVYAALILGWVHLDSIQRGYARARAG